MSEVPVPAPDTPTASGPGFAATLGNLYFSPAEAFREIVARRRWVPPLLVLMFMNLAFTGIWMRKVDPQQFMRNQMEQSGQLERIPPEQQADMLATQAKFFPIMGWVGGLVGPPVVYLAVAALFLFVFRFLFGGEVTLPQSLAITHWTFLTVALVSLPLLVLVLGLKGDWNVDPGSALQASPAALVERSEMAKPLYAFLSALDVFTLWTLFLLSTGYAAALRKPFGTAAVGVFGAWSVYVLGKVALAAIF